MELAVEKLAGVDRVLTPETIGSATAEISRTQLWQWIHHGARLDDGRPITLELHHAIRDQELKTIGDRPHAKTAAALFDRLTASDELEDFLTIPASEELLKVEQGVKS